MRPDDISPMHSRAVSAVADLLGRERLLTLACIRPDHWPQATTLGYLSEGLNLYIRVARASHTFTNLLGDDRASIAVRTTGGGYGEGVGVTMTGRFHPVEDASEIGRLEAEMTRRYPDIHLYCPSGQPSVVLKFTPHLITAVGIADGRSDPQTFRVDPADHGANPTSATAPPRRSPGRTPAPSRHEARP